MNFISPIFWIIILFFYIIWRFFISNKYNSIFLLIISSIIYSIFYPLHTLNIIIVSIFTYLLNKNNNLSLRLISIILNISHLLFYKYHELIFPDNLSFSSPSYDLVIPVGISFYTFQNLSYIFDLHRNKVKNYKCYSDYLLYITFFPQLVAGPIVRSNFFVSQLRSLRKNHKFFFWGGIERIIHGLFLKLVVADNIAVLMNDKWDKTYYWENGSDLPFCLIIAFGCQIFGDFAGYSLIAIGLALLFGFVLPRNFRSPYIACSLSKFWQRWHRTLSKWILDYLYIPLGGNKNPKINICILLVIVMLISGLWHGNTLSFGLWGALHGIALIIDRYILETKIRITKNTIVKKTYKISQVIFCFVTVMTLWIFFREQNVFLALHTLRSLLIGEFSIPRIYNLFSAYPLSFYAILIVITWHIFGYLRNYKGYSQLRLLDRILLSLFFITNCIFVPGNSTEFIYFRF